MRSTIRNLLSYQIAGVQGESKEFEGLGCCDQSPCREVTAHYEQRRMRMAFWGLNFFPARAIILLVPTPAVRYRRPKSRPGKRDLALLLSGAFSPGNYAAAARPSSD